MHSSGRDSYSGVRWAGTGYLRRHTHDTVKPMIAEYVSFLLSLWFTSVKYSTSSVEIEEKRTNAKKINIYHINLISSCGFPKSSSAFTF